MPNPSHIQAYNRGSIDTWERMTCDLLSALVGMCYVLNELSRGGFLDGAWVGGAEAGDSASRLFVVSPVPLRADP